MTIEQDVSIEQAIRNDVTVLTRKVDALVGLAVGLLDQLEAAASNPMVATMIPPDFAVTIAEVRAELVDA